MRYKRKFLNYEASRIHIIRDALLSAIQSHACLAFHLPSLTVYGGIEMVINPDGDLYTVIGCRPVFTRNISVGWLSDKLLANKISL